MELFVDLQFASEDKHNIPALVSIEKWIQSAIIAGASPKEEA